MATRRSQRVAIWIIAVALALGTIGSFIAMIYANDNMQATQARLDELMAEYDAEIAAYGKEVEAQTEALSKKYYDTFKKYESRVDAFAASGVTELQKNDLKVGTGDTLDAESTFAAYYIGWNPDGKIFDSSIDKKEKALKMPISAGPGSVIPGWTEGVVGMKVGGIRELTIPSELAYGANGNGDDIPANTPLKFVVMVIPTPKTIEYPQPSEELLRLYDSTQ